MRKYPRSIRRTAQASTRWRGIPGARMSRATTFRKRGRARANRITRSYFSWSRRSRHRGWYRYWRRPAASVPTACRWPMGCGQIHTSVHAGGMARARIRPRTSESVTRTPSGSRYTNPRPFRRRSSPAAAGSDRLSLGMPWVAFPRGGSLTELWRVGPWVARMLTDWITDPPEVPEPPALRRGFLTRADVDAALEGHDDWRAELRADLQMHTTDSDGSVPLAGMAEAAEALGYQYVGITDHSKGLPIANGMDEERLARQGEEVAAMNRSLAASGRGPRVLHSIEMNLSPEGEGDMEPDALARLDLVLGAFHSKLRLTEDQTERYLAAVRNPTVHVLAHPRCRMFDRRAGLWADWPRVFEAAAEAGTAVEIDASPYRQDLDVELLKVARDTGVRISIGTDAHSVPELGYIDYGLAAAILAGVPKECILNFQPVEDVLAWASERRRRGGVSS